MMFFRIADPTFLRGFPLCFVVLLAVVTQSFCQTSDKPQSETVRGTVINAVTQFLSLVRWSLLPTIAPES